MKRIACCTDFSANSEAAFNAARELAEKFGAELSVIHVLPPVVNPMLTDEEIILPEEPRKSLILSLEEKMQQEYGSHISDATAYELVVLDGHVSSEILGYLEEKSVDLVVLGSYGLSGMGLVFFGSVAKRVAHKARCSVMIVRSQAEKKGDQ
jgi:universal stress protein A